jgi:hypothetical protein
MMKKMRAKDEHVPRSSRAKGRTQERVTVVADPHRMMGLCGGAVGEQISVVLYKLLQEKRVLGARKGGWLCCQL